MKVNIGRTDAPCKLQVGNEWANYGSGDVGTAKKTIKNIWPFLPQHSGEPPKKSDQVRSATFSEIDNWNSGLPKFGGKRTASIEDANLNLLAASVERRCKLYKLPFRASKFQRANKKENGKFANA